MAVFTWQQQSLVCAIESALLAKPEVWLSGPLWEDFATSDLEPPSFVIDQQTEAQRGKDGARSFSVADDGP